MYNKYSKAIPGTKEFTFYSFFSAYITQDIETIEEAINDFKNEASTKSKVLLVEAIDDFLSLNYSEEEKAEFIRKLTFGWIEADTAREQLIYIRNIFAK